MTLDPTRILALLSLACSAGAALILVAYLWRKPKMGKSVKRWLFLGLGPLPIAAAVAGNVSNFELTKERRFCGSCHVMESYTKDAADLSSTTLASAHSRSPWFGDQSCYVCHADYGMFGTVTTKIGGLHHVWDFYTDDWSKPGHRPPKLYKPFSTQSCRQCHPQTSATVPLEHKVHGAAIDEGRVGCTSAGCHYPVHPSHMAKAAAHAEVAQ